MAYITARELRAVVPDQYRDAALADQGGEQPDPGLLAAVIETACQEVDALIEGRVRLPLSAPYPQKIRTAAVYFALEILFTRRGVEMPEATARKISGIRSDLGKVGAGDLRLEAPVEQTASSRQTSGSIVVRPSITGAGGMIGAILLLLFGLARPAVAIDARTFSFVAPTNPLFESPDYMEWSQAESVSLRYAVPSADSRDARWEISDATNLWLNLAPTKSGANWSWNPAPTQTCLHPGRYQGRVALYDRAGSNLVFHRIIALQDIRVHAARDPITLIFASPIATIGGETDPIFTAAASYGITTNLLAHWNAAYAWGDHAAAGYLQSETDPIFAAAAAYGITTNLLAHWNAAYAWGDHAAAGYLLPYSEIEIEGIPEPIGLWLFSEAAGVVYLKNYSASDGQSRMLNFDNGYVSGPWTFFGSNRFDGVLTFTGSGANSLRNFIGSTCENSPQILSADAGIVTVWSTGRVEQLRVASGTETVRFARAAASLSNSVGTIFHFCCGTNFVSFEPTNMTGFSTTGIYTNGATNTAVIVWQPNSSNAHWRLAVP